MPPKKRSGDDEANNQMKRRRKKNGDDVEFGLAESIESDDENLDITLEGSLVNGEVLFSGGTNWCMIGRSHLPKGVKNTGGPNLWGPHRIANLCGVRVRTVVSGCTACHNVIITAEGKVMTWGRNEKGQLGHGDDTRRDTPTHVEALANDVIIDAACGKNHTLFITARFKFFLSFFLSFRFLSFRFSFFPFLFLSVSLSFRFSFFPFLFLSVSLSFRFSFFPFLFLSVSLSFVSLSLSFRFSFFPFLFLSFLFLSFLFLSVSLFLFLSVSLSFRFSFFPFSFFRFLSVSLSFRFSFFPFLFLSVSLFRFSFFPFLFLSVSLSFRFSFFPFLFLSVSLSFSLSFRFSFFPFLFLSVSLSFRFSFFPFLFLSVSLSFRFSFFRFSFRFSFFRFSFRFSFFPFLFLSVSLSFVFFLSVFLSFRFSFFRFLSFRFSFFPFLFLSVSLSFRFSFFRFSFFPFLFLSFLFLSVSLSFRFSFFPFLFLSVSLSFRFSFFPFLFLSVSLSFRFSFFLSLSFLFLSFLFLSVSLSFRFSFFPFLFLSVSLSFRFSFFPFLFLSVSLSFRFSFFPFLFLSVSLSFRFSFFPFLFSFFFYFFKLWEDYFKKGKVFSCGDNKMGQLGIGHQSPCVPTPIRIHYKGPPIRKVACGGEFSMLADIRGNLYSFGCPEYGQLGNNSDGKYFVTSNKLSFKCDLVPKKVHVFIEKTRDGHIIPITDVEIRNIACGINHTIALDSKKRVYTWGFGGYGRLGHSEPKDELVPRHLKFFDGPNRGAAQIFAGSTFCLAVNELGNLFFWGQTKSTGEASMYPKLVQDLSGWRVRSVGCCNKSIVVAADESVISWGPSPTYGELGYGDHKPHSSTVPQEVKTLDGIYIHGVACGYGHSLYLARADTEANREKLERLPIYTP
ncbi:Protein RCC2,Protein RCC2 homolog [Acanthosepion pharaonis]|uniref:Protein RCC2,Protein RCC2 homolog n=1 Tax=Acanthosepion pharaonis TaxID=158019 RepID=A0A812D3B4_ACAPH|nr:Protein RCC2,Protein RCC2 homolog [Sepia pharaonis]